MTKGRARKPPGARVAGNNRRQEEHSRLVPASDSDAPDRGPDYKLVFEQLPGQYLILGPELRIRDASDAYLQATLTRREEIIGRNIFAVFPENPEDVSADAAAPKTRASFNRVLRTRQADVQGLQRHDVRKPESEGGGFAVRYWNVVNSPALNPDGSVAYIIHQVENVTEFVLLQQQGVEQDYLAKPFVTEELLARAAGLIARKREAEAKLRESYALLQEAHARLREADRRKDEYLTMLAHELRNPLAAITSGVNVVARRVQGEPGLKRLMESTRRQVAQMTHLLDDLLNVARLTRGEITLHPEPVEIAIVVQNALDTLRPQIEAHRHQLSVSLPSAPLLVEGDPVRLAQVVAELLDNAAQYTPDGGQITVTAARAGAEAVIRVRDTGKGIAPDLLPRVFEVFARGAHGTGSTGGGLGLGLAFVRRLVELHGGRVEAHSEGPGKGSEFVVRLPLAPGTAP